MFYLVGQDLGFEIDENGAILGLTNLFCLSYDAATEPVESPSLDDLRKRIFKENFTYKQKFKGGEMLRTSLTSRGGEHACQFNDGKSTSSIVQGPC